MARGELRRGLVAQGGVRSLMVVFVAVFLAQHFRLQQAAEDLKVEEFITEARIEALDVGVLPWTAGLDEAAFEALLFDPFPHRLRDKLGAVVGTDELGRPALPDQPRKITHDIRRCDRARHLDAQQLTTVFIDDRQPFQQAPVIGLIVDEIVGSDLVGPGGHIPLH